MCVCGGVSVWTESREGEHRKTYSTKPEGVTLAYECPPSQANGDGMASLPTCEYKKSMWTVHVSYTHVAQLHGANHSGHVILLLLLLRWMPPLLPLLCACAAAAAVCVRARVPPPLLLLLCMCMYTAAV